jgi:hypothetical protein
VEGHVSIRLPSSVVIVSIYLEVVAEGGGHATDVSGHGGWQGSS